MSVSHTAGDEPVDVDALGLPDPVRAVHRLPVLGRVPVVLDKYDRVGAGQREPKPANRGGQQQQVDGWVIVERVRHRLAFGRRHAAV